ncbi:kinase-like protein [Rhizodiscina lignyota]|uniref:Kinase-like protein n=1 Tax=Rhizodiscina lignyota TaxID=1504668 RepID=A0A9P4IS29_9PEZI|nr:kinase-like protein [Rhizodiscina lignyota]
METKELGDAHKRLSRPQDPSLPTIPIPTAINLKRKERSFSIDLQTPRKYGEEQYLREVGGEQLWEGYEYWGTLTQDKVEYELCSKEHGAVKRMFKKCGASRGRKELKALCNLRHAHIIQVQESFLADNTIYLGLEYCRLRLADALCVPLSSEHIQAIAYDVFDAIKYLHSQNIVHQRVSAISVRFGSSYANIVIADFELAESFDNPAPNTDLEGLGRLLIDCMNGTISPHHTAEFVRQERRANRVFGLINPERWSGNKVLMDFLDDLYSLSRPVEQKFAKIVS